jgi:hypothetical protein
MQGIVMGTVGLKHCQRGNLGKLALTVIPATTPHVPSTDVHTPRKLRFLLKRVFFSYKGQPASILDFTKKLSQDSLTEAF